MNINLSNGFAKAQTKFFRFLADKFFARRYGHRAVVLETIAGVPGMVAGMWIHLKSLRQMRTGYGPMIRELLAEAEKRRGAGAGVRARKAGHRGPVAGREEQQLQQQQGRAG